MMIVHQSRPRMSLIRQMKRCTLLSLPVLLLYLFPSSVFAQYTLRLNNTDQAPPLMVCPGQKPPTKKSVPNSTDVVLEVPTMEEVGSAIFEMRKELNNNDHPSRLNLPRNTQGPIRIGIWGDSHTAANFFTEELIQAIGLNREDVGRSYFAANIGRAGVRLPIQKSCLGGGWKFDYAHQSQAAMNSGGEFPIGMIRLQSKNWNSYLWLDFRAQNLNANMRSLQILIDPIGTDHRTVIGISVDQLPETMLELDGQNKNILLEADEPFSIVKIRLIKGAVSLDGFLPQYVTPAKLIIDTLAIPGSTAKAWTHLNQPTNLVPNYDLVFLAYGTNEGNSPKFDSSLYQTDLRQGLVNFRKVYPQAACVLIGPTDRGVLVPSNRKNKHSKKKAPVTPPNQLLKYSKIHAEIAHLQALEAKNAGCEFWNWQAAMGGMGSAYAWAYEKPALMARDLTHLTISGYQKSARLFSNDLQLKQLLNPD